MGVLQRNEFTELRSRVHRMLATYSNVHRGSGHNSQTTTRLFEESRRIVLEHLGYTGWRSRRMALVFCSPRQADRLAAQLPSGRFRRASSEDIGLPLGVTALAIPRRDLPSGAPVATGGGTARLVAPSWVVWSRAPERFEPGTPSIVNVYAWAQALVLVGHQQPLPTHASDGAFADLDPRLTGRALLNEVRRTLIGRDLLVPTNRGVRTFIHLDNAASTRTFEPVWAAAGRAWEATPEARAALVQGAKDTCARVLGAPAADYDVVFTGNATEALNLVAESLALAPNPEGSVVVNTVLEHNSNELPWRAGTTLRLGVDDQGFWDLEELEKLLVAYNEERRFPGQRIDLVAVSGASNVLGTCNELGPVAALAHRYGARVLVDGAQLVAHRALDLVAEGIDYLVFSGHKVYAPFGTGALVVRRGLLGFPRAELDRIRASGEANVGGIAALGAALELLARVGFDAIEAEESALTRTLVQGLGALPGVTVYGVADPGSPRFARRVGVVSFSHPRFMAHAVTQALADAGIGSRGGCHCAHLLVKRLLGISPGLERFQRLIVSTFPRLELPGVARVSLGLENTADQVEACVAVLSEVVRARGVAR